MTRVPLPVPATGAELTLEWLRAALAGPAPPAAPADPVSGGATTERIGRDIGLASEIFRCRLPESTGPRSVVVKLWATDGPAGSREVPFYDSFSRRLGVRVPRCHHGAIDPARRRGVLVLEDLEHAVQGDCLLQLDAAGARAMADTLAALHATWWESPELRATAWLPPVIEHAPGELLSRRESFLHRFGGRLDPELRRLLDRVEALEARSAERLAGAAVTLLHADLHLDNVVFEGGPERPVLLDWARVSRGPAVLDAAELLFSMAPIAELERNLDRYRAGLNRRGVAGAGADTLRLQLGGALLRKVIRATCGVAHWQPASDRGREMIARELQRIPTAVEFWRRQDPDLFRF